MESDKPSRLPSPTNILPLAGLHLLKVYNLPPYRELSVQTYDESIEDILIQTTTLGYVLS